MPCLPIEVDRHGRGHGHMCFSKDVKLKVGPCVFCGKRGSLQCDGPPADAPDQSVDSMNKRTCDAPMCERCARSLRHIDVDICPRCSELPTPEDFCSISTVTGPVLAVDSPCRGPYIVNEGLCLRHALLFQFWFLHRGGEAVYQDQAIERGMKRTRFREWLAKLTPGHVRKICRIKSEVIP